MSIADRFILSSNSGSQGFVIPDLSLESADATNEVLHHNHKKNHIMWDGVRMYHNHIAHHQLAIFALGATPAQVRKAYEINLHDQREIGDVDPNILRELHDPTTFSKHLGDQTKYSSLLSFFEEEVNRLGWKQAVKEYFLKGDDRANDLLGRLFGGFIHPIIHLGCGIEFEQPALIAEALAQAAIHETTMGKFLLEAEEAARSHGDPDKSLFALLDEVQADEQLRHSTKYSDGDLILERVLLRAPEAMMNAMSQVKVRLSDLELRTAEMINFNAFMTAAAQRPDKEIKMDFFLLHTINCSVFYSAFLNQDWLSPSDRVRLLEYKIRIDYALYVSRGNPQLYEDDIKDYRPDHPDRSSWEALFQRMVVFEDEGHASKLVRALANGERACKKFEGCNGLAKHFKVTGPDWLSIANMTVDSVERAKATHTSMWVRHCGFDEAWEE